ncbi:MAG: sigma-70 region 4 domain-containing protein [Gemmatimonadaceae bacterium]
MHDSTSSVHSRKLAPGARRVFVLHDVQGYRHEEIARLLGIAESTVRVQLHRARKQLLEVLNG